MEFLKHMEEREESIREREFLAKQPKLKLVNKKSYQFRRFKPFLVGDEFGISIQAGYGTYSTPAYTFDDLSIYQTMEMAIVKEQGLVTVSEVMPYFQYLKEIEEFYNDLIYAEVPVELIELVFQEAMRMKKDIEKIE